ncbi:hypothetical protein LEP1GSC172_4351 [Leptospira noguchii]|uniref:Uncharacterized protein n=1 Tax=Leptospira noguchii TaxID=28182 RepID=M6VYZ9_9LEPT|nr:hypothetical protein LEP1GSC172_4351 [Leptospira noguchii]
MHTPLLFFLTKKSPFVFYNSLKKIKDCAHFLSTSLKNGLFYLTNIVLKKDYAEFFIFHRVIF